MAFFFFFSSRRRHTRLQGDWSSDVCSSDLHDGIGLGADPIPLAVLADEDFLAVHRLACVQFGAVGDRKSTRLNSSHLVISYAVFCLKKKKKNIHTLLHDRLYFTGDSLSDSLDSRARASIIGSN